MKSCYSTQSISLIRIPSPPPQQLERQERMNGRSLLEADPDAELLEPEVVDPETGRALLQDVATQDQNAAGTTPTPSSGLNAKALQVSASLHLSCGQRGTLK